MKINNSSSRINLLCNKFLLDMFKYFKYIQKWNCFISNIIKVLCHVFTYKDSVFQSENEREL